jgi:hypothetical protein
VRTSSYRRRICRLAAGALALSLLVSQGALAQETIGGARIVVNDVKGVVPSREPAVLRAGIDVFQNELIRTGPQSASTILFQDNTNLSIGSNSQVTLDRFVFDPDPAKSAVALSIAKGVARFTTGSLPKSAYRISTPTATIGIRGTIVTITVAEDGTSIITVEDGIAFVTSGGQTVEVDAGMTTTTSSGMPPTPPKPKPPTPPGQVVEMDFLLSDGALPPGPPADDASKYALDTVGEIAVPLAAVLVVILIVGSSSSTSTH